MNRFEILFTGHVQGVGFRYSVRRISRSFNVVGTIQNLNSGKVRVVVEGSEGEVERFIESINESAPGHISKIERSLDTPTGEFSGFEIIR